jgi:CHASE3 domain sensor protein
MKNFSIGLRLALAFTAMLVITGAVAASGYWGVQRISAVTYGLVEGAFKRSETLAEAAFGVLTLRRYEKDLMLSIGDGEAQSGYAGKWNGALAHVKTKLDALAKLAESEADQKALESARRALAQYEGGFAKVHGAIRSGDAATPQVANQLMSEFKDPIRALSDALEAKSVKEVEGQVELVRSAQRTVRNTLAFILLVGAILGAGLSLYITRSITGPIRLAVGAVEKMAAGDLREVPWWTGRTRRGGCSRR